MYFHPNYFTRLKAFSILFFQLYKERSKLRVEFFKSLPVDAITTSGAVDGSVDQSCVFQFFQMLAYRALGERQSFNDLTTDTFILFRQYIQYGDTGRVADRFGKGGQGLFFRAEFFFFVKRHGLKNYKSQITRTKFESQSFELHLGSFILYRKYTIKKTRRANIFEKLFLTRQ